MHIYALNMAQIGHKRGGIGFSGNEKSTLAPAKQSIAVQNKG